MAAQKSLEIHYTNEESWFPQIAPQLKAVYTGTTLTFDNEIGKGDFYKVEIDWGLRVRKVDVLFHKPVIFERRGAALSRTGYYALISNLSEEYVEAATNEHHFSLGYSTENGLYFSSPYLSSTLSFRPGVQYRLVFVAITHERIRDFIARQPERQYELLQSIIDKDKPLYHVECLTPALMNIAKDIYRNLNDERPNNLLLHSRTLELCYQMLNMVDQRSTNGSTHKIHQDEIVKLNAIKRSLLDGYQQQCPPIAVAAKKAAMSPTKFKRLFKQMFGHTYYQFYKNIRMHKAKELLEQHKMNVSEVGYMLGYNNLGKFTKAFKDMFEITPGKLAEV